jgi:hypothetical protein
MGTLTKGDNVNREKLEDAVWSLDTIRSSGIEFDAIQSLTTAQLRGMLATVDNVDDVPIKRIKPTRRVLKEHWSKVSDTIELIDGELCTVQVWTSSYGRSKQHNIKCGNRVVFEGCTMSTSIVRHYLLTGERVQRVPKPVKFRAVVRVGSRTVHLGYFDSEAERDAVKGKHLELISRKPLTD